MLYYWTFGDETPYFPYDMLQARTVEKILAQLESSNSLAEQVAVLKQLSELSVDVTFAQEFINDNGLKLIISKIENDSW